MSVVTVALISSLLLCLFPQTPAAYGPMNYACCVKYTREPLPFSWIKGYIEQSSREVCRMDAIIFFTKHKKKVCASINDNWVKEILYRLSSKMNKKTRTRHQHLTTAKMDSSP
ncbi:C-C motif chemokine 20 [Misgurnus anguillicaudatus]|uniref:C-C motif chemokine 20 n=1 Tax=Misgurnus anguillicaudatus TaxID=75329 RepID=UPI003CCFDF21